MYYTFYLSVYVVHKVSGQYVTTKNNFLKKIVIKLKFLCVLECGPTIDLEL